VAKDNGRTKGVKNAEKFRGRSPQFAAKGSLDALGGKALRHKEGRKQPKAKSDGTQQSRAGLRIISSWNKPEVHQTQKIISAEYRITQQELMREAFNLLFEKYGKARIA
jgi:hypothetical protein